MFKLLFCISLTVFLSSCAGKEVETKPNVVVIVTDDQGWGDLSISGNTNLSTPHIDNLSETGVSFDRFYVSPVCAPTRAELLTGRYALRTGVTGVSRGKERINLDEITIADIFKDAGYATAAYGKWHNGTQAPYHPNARGFDDFYGFCSGHWGNYFSPMLEHNGEIVKGNGFIIDDLTSKGLSFIEKNKEQPFFLYLPYNTPHSPDQVPDTYWNRFENKELKMRNRNSEKEDIQKTKAALAMCENIDWNVGRVANKLKELELLENTIVIYLSDNGPNGVRWNDGMKGKKGSTDEGGVRSPFFIKWVGKLKAGKIISEIASAMDILPTLVDLAGIDYTSKKKLDGISLMPLLMDEKSNWEDRFIVSHWGGKISVRNQQYRLGAEGSLFDMVKDPSQTHDLSSEKIVLTKQLISAKDTWKTEVLSKVPEYDTRTLPIGDPNYQYTQIPARDGTASGEIKRSNHFPNCSFFSNWISTNDSITWEVEVLEEGEFEVDIYYTCPKEDVGAVFELSFNNSKLTGKITKSHNPPLTGMEHDRVLRKASYVKDFKKMTVGSIYLKKGNGILTLKALEMPGSQVMDFRLVMLKRIK